MEATHHGADAPRSLADLPPAFGLWIRQLWRQALFPGRLTGEATALRSWSLFCLLLVPGLLLYPSLSFAFFEPDETRYAQIPREMLQRGEWIVPLLQSEPYLDKPPLFYWLVMGCYQLLGVSVAAARLVPALCLHATILLVYLFGRRWLGERAAFRGAMLLSLAPGFLGMGRLLILDGVLTLWTTLALLAAFEATRGESLRRGWWLLSAVACGLGVLTKGPVAVILLAVPLLLQRWLTGSGAPLGWRACLGYAGLVALVCVPWYVAVCVSRPDFIRHFLWEHNVVRFLAPFDHRRGVWFYLPIVLGGLLPGTLLLVPFFRFLFSGQPEDAARRTPELGFLLLAGGWTLLFFTVSGCKLPTYILPAFPLLALALGYFLAGSRWGEGRAAAGLGVTAFAVLVLGNHVLVPWYAEFRSPLRQPEVLARFCEGQPLVCYPRPCNAVAFHLRRDDLKHYRSKDIEQLRSVVRQQPRTVILCTHRHSLEGLRQLLPPEVRIVESRRLALPRLPLLPDAWQERATRWLGETALGLADVAVIERKPRSRQQRADTLRSPQPGS